MSGTLDGTEGRPTGFEAAPNGDRSGRIAKAPPPATFQLIEMYL